MIATSGRAGHLERGMRSFNALYEHWERNQWSPLEIDLSVDARSYAALDDEGRRALLWLFAHRFDAEACVARLLAPFLLAAPDEDMQLVIATQVADENRHVQAVIRVYEQVFGIQGGAAAVAETAARYANPVEREMFAELEEPVMALVEGFDEYRYARAVFAYHVLGEGVMARASQNLSVGRFAALGDFPGILAGQHRVFLDESRHIGIGLTYLSHALRRAPDTVRESLQDAIRDWRAIALNLLARFQAEAQGDVFAGYGVDAMGFFAEANRLLGKRMQAIGLGDLL